MRAVHLAALVLFAVESAAFVVPARCTGGNYCAPTHYAGGLRCAPMMRERCPPPPPGAPSAFDTFKRWTLIQLSADAASVSVLCLGTQETPIQLYYEQNARCTAPPLHRTTHASRALLPSHPGIARSTPRMRGSAALDMPCDESDALCVPCCSHRVQVLLWVLLGPALITFGAVWARITQSDADERYGENDFFVQKMGGKAAVQSLRYTISESMRF